MGFGADTPRSFGRQEKAPEPAVGPVILPYPVHVPVTLVIDEQALQDFATRVQAVIADAFMRGVECAISGLEKQMDGAEIEDLSDASVGGPKAAASV